MLSLLLFQFAKKMPHSSCCLIIYSQMGPKVKSTVVINWNLIMSSLHHCRLVNLQGTSWEQPDREEWPEEMLHETEQKVFNNNIIRLWVFLIWIYPFTVTGHLKCFLQNPQIKQNIKLTVPEFGFITAAGETWVGLGLVFLFTAELWHEGLIYLH